MSILEAKRLKEILSYDEKSGDFFWKKIKHYRFKPGDKAGCLNTLGYVQIKFDNKIYLAHRLAWLFYYDKNPLNKIDHINGNPSDNRIVNLRDCYHGENLLNRSKQKNNTSGFKNVSWSKTMNSWLVRMQINKKNIVIGYYLDALIANKHAIEARIKLQNQFAIDNRGETCLF